MTLKSFSPSIGCTLILPQIFQNETPVISNVDPELNFYMSKLLIRVRWIIKESKNPYTDFPQTKSLVNYLIKPRDACLYLDTMYYNNTMNIHGCVRTFKHQPQNDTLFIIL